MDDLNIFNFGTSSKVKPGSLKSRRPAPSGRDTGSSSRSKMPPSEAEIYTGGGSYSEEHSSFSSGPESGNEDSGEFRSRRPRR